METTYSIKNFAMRIATAVVLLCVIGIGNVWGTKITDYSDIESGKTYYIGATTSSTDYYLYVDGSTLSASIAGTAVTSKASATQFVFTGSGTSWTIKFADGSYYLGLKNSKDNGKVQVVESACTFTASNNGDFIRLTESTASYAIEKNNTTTNFGSYGKSMTDIWLEEVSSTYTVTYSDNDATSGTAPTDNTAYSSSNNTVTILGNTGNLSKTGFVFSGWNTEANGSGMTYSPSGTFTISTDITLYAYWLGARYNLLTDLDNLEEDDEIIIVNTGVSHALSTEQGTNNRGASNYLITNQDKTTVTLTGSSVQSLTVGKVGDDWTFYTGDGYLCAPGSGGNNYLKTAANSSENNSHWEIVINGDNEASITAQGGGNNVMQYNNGNTIFSCYGTASQTALKIYYKKARQLTFFRTKCYREFTDEEGDGLWGTDGNWTNSHQPNINDLARIKKPVTVDVTDAKAKNVILNQNGNTGKLTIQANKALEVAGTVTRTTDGSNSLPTRPEDLILESSSAGNATLIFDNSNSDQATVYLYSKGYTNKIIGDGGVWNWQFIGVPVTNATRLSDYYDGYMYEWDNSIPGWVDKTDFDATLTPFTAYSVSYPTTSDNLHTYEIDGTLVATGNKSIDIPKNTSVMAVANSWTAPIDIASITFTNTSPQNIFLYNTGYNYEDKAGTEGTRFAPGKYICVPKNSASLVGEPFIASMQGFLVKNKLNTDGTINIDYNTVVRPSTSREIVAGEMHAPARNKKEEEVSPVVMKIFVIGSEYDDRVILLEREDFSRGFDDGWDGEKFQVNAVKTAPRLFAINETGGKEEVSAVPEMEGTMIGFRPGTDTNYKITFEYEGEKTLYLLDTKTGFSTLICKTCEYEFSSNGENEDARFIIAKSPATATGVDNSAAGSKNVYKMVLDDHIYIIRNGKMYDVTGILCK